MVSVRATIEIARSPAHVRKVVSAETLPPVQLLPSKPTNHDIKLTDFPKYPEWVQGSIKSVEVISADGSISVGDKVKISFPGMGTFSGEIAVST